MKKTITTILLAVTLLPAGAQQTISNDTIVGLLVNAKGKIIKNAVVSIKDKTSETNRYGIFQLNQVSLTDTLNITLPDKTVLNIPVGGIAYPKITPEPLTIRESKEEIMKISMRALRRSRGSSSSVSISGEELVATGQSNLFNALAGKVSGFTVVTKENGEISAQLRGGTSFSLDTSPLYIVDGATVERLDNININDIKKVEIFKDSNIYGVKGANGVISVTLK